MRASRSALDFKGVHLRTHRARLGSEHYQVDRNGSRYQDRTWGPRLGLSRSSGSSVASAITGISGFLGADGLLKVVLIQGTSIEGETEPVPNWNQGIGGIGSSWFTVNG